MTQIFKLGFGLALVLYGCGESAAAPVDAHVQDASVGDGRSSDAQIVDTSREPTTFDAQVADAPVDTALRDVTADGDASRADAGIDASTEAALPTWVQSNPSARPSARAYVSMAYDEARGRVVLFGGLAMLGGSGGGPRDDTWEWDGTTWTQIATTTQPSRRNTALVYDAHRRRVLLFGGSLVNGVANDLWEWDGQTWTEIVVSGTRPSARDSHALAYDTQRHRLVLFGGYDDLSDTWEWDSQTETWSERTPSTTPSGRYYAAMAYDAQRQRVVLFSGDPSGSVGDTWEWNGEAGTWSEASQVGPTGRSAACMTYDSERRRIVLFGGWADRYARSIADVWEWDGQTWTMISADGIWTNPPGWIPARYRAGMAYDRTRHDMVVFGGDRGGGGSNYGNDTWIMRRN